MNKNKKEKIKKIKMLLTDVDGVLTDGGMYYSEKGEIMKKFNTRDGMGIELLRKNKISTIMITRENSEIVKARAKKLKVLKYFINIQEKEKLLNRICADYNVSPDEIAYIGDDINDYAIMKKIGLSCSPKDANIKIKSISDYVCKSKGGDGALREVADMILFHRNY